ncbi:hypothetical protein, partial [Streptococcus sobrinus]
MDKTLLQLFNQNKQLQEWQDKTGLLGRQLVMGLSGASKSLAIAGNFLANQGKLVILTASQNEAENLA